MIWTIRFKAPASKKNNNHKKSIWNAKPNCRYWKKTTPLQFVRNKKQEQFALADLSEAQALVAAKIELVTTERALAEAERINHLAEMAAEQEAETKAIRTRSTAMTEQQVSADRSAALLEQAETEQKTGELLNDIKAKELATQTKNHHQLIAAENTMSEALIAMKNEQLRLQMLPTVMAEAVKPAQKFDSIKVHHISGLNENSEISTAPVNQTIDAIMKMAVQWPSLIKIGKELKESLQDD